MVKRVLKLLFIYSVALTEIDGRSGAGTLKASCYRKELMFLYHLLVVFLVLIRF